MTDDVEYDINVTILILIDGFLQLKTMEMKCIRM